MTLVKICGITRVEDALTAVEHGADMLGFVFAPSPRRITPEAAAQIIEILPENIITVGVFVDEERSLVEETASTCSLHFAQLHGSEIPEYLRELSIPAIKAFRARNKAVLARIMDFNVDTFLLDSYDPVKTGGTGKTFDWDIAAQASKMGKMILAGGLNPENVSEAIRRVRPYAVDVSSGVESSPGIKDHGKLRKFIAEAKACARE